MKLLRIPFLERKLAALKAEAVAVAAPEIARVAKEELVSEYARAVKANWLQPQVPNAYPQVGGSPYPLYGYDRPIWFSTPNSPRKRPDSLVTVDVIRQFADTYDIMRSCIIHLKREVQAQGFKIAARDGRDDSPATLNRIYEANEFFTKRGGLGECNESRRHFEQKIFEDVLVIGAFAVWKNRTRGGKLLQAIPIDAATIRPRMDAYGWPGPGEDWYEQWILGMLIEGFPPEELTYDGLWPMTYTPWFRSPVEYLITTTLSALKSDEWNRTWLTTGNTPSDIVTVPPEWTPGQIAEYSEYFNAMLAGDIKGRQRTQFLPASGIQKATRKDADFEAFDMWLARRTGAIYGVQLSSIGFAGEQYKVSQEGSNNQTTQFGAGALLDLRKDFYDEILTDLGYPDLECVNTSGVEEPMVEKTTRAVAAKQGGLVSVNEGRKIIGLDPVAGGNDVIQTEPETATEDAKGAETDEEAETEADLNRWMRKALKRVREGQSAVCEFDSEFVAADVAVKVRAGLSGARTPGEVRAVFRSL